MDLGRRSFARARSAQAGTPQKGGRADPWGSRHKNPAGAQQHRDALRDAQRDVLCSAGGAEGTSREAVGGQLSPTSADGLTRLCFLGGFLLPLRSGTDHILVVATSH